jgi:hypothetical protein
MLAFQILDEDGNTLVFEDGGSIVQDGYRIEDTDAAANNEFFQTQTRDLNFIDFSEMNPFSEGSSW